MLSILDPASPLWPRQLEPAAELFQQSSASYESSHDGIDASSCSAPAAGANGADGRAREPRLAAWRALSVRESCHGGGGGHTGGGGGHTGGGGTVQPSLSTAGGPSTLGDPMGVGRSSWTAAVLTVPSSHSLAEVPRDVS